MALTIKDISISSIFFATFRKMLMLDLATVNQSPQHDIGNTKKK